VRVGRAVALALGRAGFDVAIAYHRSASAARVVVRRLRALGARGVAFRADLADPAAARRLVAQTRRALGGLDVLVNNAARFERTPFATTTEAAFDRHLDLNLRAAFFCSQAAARVMRGRGGWIVNIGDAGAHRAWPSYIPYTLSKAALPALTRSLAAALRPHGIRVNCVAPGAVLRPPGFPRARWKRVTRGRVSRVDEVTGAVVSFATCAPSVTGRVRSVG